MGTFVHENKPEVVQTIESKCEANNWKDMQALNRQGWHDASEGLLRQRRSSFVLRLSREHHAARAVAARSAASSAARRGDRPALLMLYSEQQKTRARPSCTVYCAASCTGCPFWEAGAHGVMAPHQQLVGVTLPRWLRHRYGYFKQAGHYNIPSRASCAATQGPGGTSLGAGAPSSVL